MGQLTVLDRTGHRATAWDTATLAKAKEEFDQLLGKGYLAYKTAPGSGSGEVIKAFDPDATEIVMTPPLVGG